MLYLLISFYNQPICIFIFKMCFSSQHIIGQFFFINYDNFYLLTEVSRLFKFKVFMWFK